MDTGGRKQFDFDVDIKYRYRYVVRTFRSNAKIPG